MKHVGTILGAALAGLFVFGVWGKFAAAYGIGGGWFAGLAIISIMWFMNHFVGLINNDGAFVDQGLAVGIAGTTMGGFNDGFDTIAASFPTLGLVLLGACCGGITAGLFQKYQANKAN
ncbi:MAG: hypothetical protein CVU84_10515 [Firmicutes bacterium HGW-Firmicutes-1]|jgi:hypothetical protein|nr:MAG: hypothetical protein CVU84_10515 [Firmicutes bacterium HGW-Firmicutes-1]